MKPPALSLGRASAMLMLLFTERYYRGCAVRAGRPTWPGPSAGIDLLLRSFGAFWSGEWADREMRRIERRFLAQPVPDSSQLLTQARSGSPAESA